MPKYNRMDVGRAIFYGCLAIAWVWVLFPPRTYIYNLMPYQPPEPPPAA